MKKRISETMKNIKIVILVFCLLFLSGCSATYEINIKDDKIIENLKVIETNKTIFDKVNDAGWTIRDSFNSFLERDEFSVEEYKVRSLENEDQLGIEYSSSASESILNSSVLNQCYTNPTLNKVDDIVTIDTGTNFDCYDLYENLDSIKIVLKTNHKIVSTNADLVDGNSYIWNITKDSNKQIVISYYDSIVSNSIDYKILILGFSVLVLFGIFIYFVIRKFKKNNEI